MSNQIMLLLLLGAALSQAQSPTWDYADQQQWQTDYPMCNGSRQSPIRINTAQTTLRPYPGIKFSNYDNLDNVTIGNNGHTAEIKYPTESDRPQISGGPLDMNAQYQLANIHFHWGANDTLGAEHVINNERYSMEVHVVHYNRKYASLQEATNYADGIAVLAVFYRGNPHQGLIGLQGISNALPQIEMPDTETEIESFQLSALLNGLKQRTYYSYAGSLTTPPCSEAVTWIIYPKPILVKSEQLEPFRSLKDKMGEPLVNNFRQLQDKYGRKVYQGRNKRPSLFFF